MTEPLLIHIPEPKLTFGFNQKIEDPRDGLTLFGAYTHKSHKGEIRVGIIGAKTQREFVKQYLKRLHQPIHSEIKDIARPYFPGLQSAFGIEINIENIQEIDIPKTEIEKYLQYIDGHQRVFNLTDLFANKLKKYLNEEHIPVSVWFVAISDEIYQFGKNKSSIPKSKENIKIGLSKKDRVLQSNFLFEEMNELKEAYNYEINFHNQLKAKLLNIKVVTQIIKESTIHYQTLWTNEKKIQSQRIFDTAKAWNISTTLYYKSGGLPWKLGEVRKSVCYLGLVYKQIDSSIDTKNACCAAQMFLDSGDGMVFRGTIGPWYNPQTKEFHISKKDAFELLSMSIESFKEKSETNEYPNEIFIHSKTNFDDEEWEGFNEATNGKCKIIGIRIKDDNTFKLYREFSYCVPRGTALLVTDNLAYLWTKGYIPRLKTQLGLETPNPISVEIIRGNSNIESVCKDVLALTKLNYNACIFADGSPVTLRFADSIGEVLTAGKDIKSEVLPFKHYV